MTAADIDNDGAMDLAVVNYSSNSISILKNGAIPLQVVSTFPLCNALNTPQNITITATFDVDVNPSTLNDSTVRINGSLSGLHTNTFSYNLGTRTITIMPNAQFKVGEVVTVSLTRGIENATGNPMMNPYSWNFTVQVHSGTGFFRKPLTVSVGSFPSSVTAADWDGDGVVDLAVVNAGVDSVSILKNDGTGVFTQTSTVFVIKRDQNSTPRASLTAVDVDGNGVMDLAVADRMITILKNNGSGTFTRELNEIYLNGTPRSMAATDVDGDGDVDLASTKATGVSISIVKNFRNGWFAETSTVDLDYFVSFSIAATDVDNDGAMECAVVGSNFISTGANVFILKNEGSGTFAEAFGLRVDKACLAVAATDFDGDGDVDLAVTSYVGRTVSILKNDGSGTFTLTSTVDIGNYPQSIIAADLDGDGDMDLAAGSQSSTNVSILNNDGSGTFTLTSTIIVGNMPTSIAAADVDGDGAIDLVAANYGSNSVSILRNGAHLLETELDISQGWNLVSVPRVQTNDSASVIFPGKSGSMFEYNTATKQYATAPILACGKGYWVLYGSPDTVTITGSVPGPLTDTVAQAGMGTCGIP